MSAKTRLLTFAPNVTVHLFESLPVEKKIEPLKDHSTEATVSSAIRIFANQRIKTMVKDISSMEATLANCKSLTPSAKNGWETSIELYTNKLGYYKDILGKSPEIAEMMKNIGVLKNHLDRIPFPPSPKISYKC